jgi:hypothetical protein
MAQIACELSDLERPIPRWEVLAVDELAKAVGALVPSAVDFVAVEELRRLDREWLRVKLARLAANRTEHDPRFYEHAWRGKLVTQLAQAECRDPEYLDALLDDLKAPTKVARTPYELLDQLPLPQLRTFVRARIQELSALDTSGARRRWQRHRQQLEAIYTVGSLIETLGFLLEEAGPIPEVFNIESLAEHWGTIEGSLGKIRLQDPLPDVAAARAAGMRGSVIAGRILQPLAERLMTPAKLPTSRTAMYVALLQVEAGLADDAPGTGNVFDCERAIALHEVDIFHSNDAKLVHQAKQARTQLDLGDVVIVEGEKELRRALERIAAERRL